MTSTWQFPSADFSEAIEKAAAAMSERVVPMRPWADTDPEDQKRYRDDALLMVGIAFPILFGPYGAEMRRLRAERDEARAALAEARAENKRLREDNAAHIERTIFQRGELGRLASALAEAHRTLADVGEPSWEYGIQLDGELGWISEPRGPNYAYAFHRRRVWHGRPEYADGTPLQPSTSGAESAGEQQG